VGGHLLPEGDGGMIINNAVPLNPKDWTEPGPHIGWALYALGVHRLREGAGAAKLKGWQYVAPRSKSGVVLTRYVLGDGPGETLDNAISQRAKAAYGKLVALPGAQEKDQAYEVRALCIHALQLRVMWLHAVAGGTDRVIPYGSYLGDLQVGQEYSLAAFMKIARREAAKLTLEPAY
jgi:hypothetical protein